MIYVYNLLAVLLVLLAIPLFIVRTVREDGFEKRLRQIFGFVPKEEIDKVAGKDCIWLHAASVGEIVATSPIAKEIRKEYPGTPLLISVVTTAGYQMAKRIIPDADAIIFFPLDLPWLSYRLQKQIRPRVFLLVETELWPNFLRSCKALSIPVMMVNGRISDKSVKQYRYLFGLVQEMLDTVVQFCMQSLIDAQYIISLGADPRKVVVTGNTKFDQTYTDINPAERRALYRQFFAGDKAPVIVAGSTHKGEEEFILQAFSAVKQEFSNAALVLAPREVMRAEEIVNLSSQYGFSAVQRTKLPTAQGCDNDVVILDTIGELGKIYSIGDVVFVGGSLVAKGGHNLLEPAAHGKPILVGPHMFNFKDTYALLTECGACKTVYDSDDLAANIKMILNNEQQLRKMSESAAEVISQNRGAARKSVVLLKEILAVNAGI